MTFEFIFPCHRKTVDTKVHAFFGQKIVTDGQVQFYFIFIFLFDPSWSESIRVDPTRTGGPS